MFSNICIVDFWFDKVDIGAPGPLSRLSVSGFSSGHDLTVCGFEPHVGFCAVGEETAWDSLTTSLCLFLSLFLKINLKQLKQK